MKPKPAAPTPANGVKGMKTDHHTSSEIELSSIERGLSTAITALEILTGICAGLEDVAPEEVIPDVVEGELLFSSRKRVDG
jgi:hypothetical protein